MERKRVKIYKPGGMTNNISLDQFQVGGPAGMTMAQATPQEDSSSAQLQQIVMTYAQTAGMNEQEAQQLMQSILQMPADQQQQAVAMMTQEMNQAAPTVARFGGDMKATKKLLKKAIGGAMSDGEGMDNVIDARKQAFSNILGANMARNLVDTAAKDATSSQVMAQPSGIQMPAPMARYGGNMNMFDIGGMWNGAGFENPFYNNNMQGAVQGAQDYANRRQGALDATRGFMDSLGDLAGNIRMETVVKKKGDIFENPSNVSAQKSAYMPSFFEMDADKNVIPDYLQRDYAEQFNPDLANRRDGGALNMYQTAGTTYEPNVQYSQTLRNARDKYAQYKPTDYTQLMKLYNEGKIPQKDFVDVADAYGIQIPANGTPTANPTITTPGATTGTGGYTGQVGPYYFVNGQNMGPIADLQGTGVNGYNYANILQQGAGRFGLPGTATDFMKGLANPANLKAFSTALTGFQPEGVYLNKVKGRMGPFGAKFKMTWEYGPDGKPVQVPTVDNGSDSGTRGDGFLSRLGNPMDWMRNARGRRDAGMSEEDFATKNARRAQRRGWNDESTPESTYTSNELSTGVSTPTGGSGIGSMEREEGPYGQTPTTPTPPMMIRPTTPMTYGPDDFMTDQYDFGGKTGRRAGKLVIKDKWTAEGMPMAGALLTGMDALSASLEQPDFNENMYMPDAWEQVLKDSRTANPMSRGVNPVGPLRGMQIPDIKPLNEGNRWSFGPGNLLSGQSPYSGYSKMGGNTYQDGGTSTPEGLYKMALGERQYMLQNPDMWQGDEQMMNPDGSYNLCLDCINVDYNDPYQVNDAARLINEGYSRGTHYNAKEFNEALKKYGITPPVYGSALTPRVQQESDQQHFEVGGTYMLDQDEIDDIINNGGTVQYI